MTKRSKNWLILAGIFLLILVLKNPFIWIFDKIFLILDKSLGIIAPIGIFVCLGMFLYTFRKPSGSSK